MARQAYAKVGTGEGGFVGAGSGVAGMAHGSWTMWVLSHVLDIVSWAPYECQRMSCREARP